MQRILIISICVGTIGFLFVFSLSITSNTVSTSIIRGLISFLVFAVFYSFLHKLLAYALEDYPQGNDEVEAALHDQLEQEETAKDQEKANYPIHNENLEEYDDIIGRTSVFVSDLMKEEN